MGGGKKYLINRERHAKQQQSDLRSDEKPHRAALYAIFSVYNLRIALSLVEYPLVLPRVTARIGASARQKTASSGAHCDSFGLRHFAPMADRLIAARKTAAAIRGGWLGAGSRPPSCRSLR
jgi:hypothetical protein